MKTLPVLTFCCVLALAATRGEEPLSGHAAALFNQAKAGRWFSEAAKLKPQILPSTDGQSFLVVWRASKEPKHWIISLHGSHGFATDDLAIWQRHLNGRDVGVLCVQWWLGGGDATSDYYSPLQVYREIDLAAKALGIQPGSVLFHGFSRGSANSYAIAAIDHGHGRKLFNLCVASSGGVGLEYPPTRALMRGEFGPRPLEGTRWITSAGGKDPNPERDGIPGMKNAAAWLRDQGASILLSIEDPTSGHGALVTNPKNAKQVLDAWLGLSKEVPKR